MNMNYIVKLTKKAKKTFDRLDQKTKERINKSFHELINFYEGKGTSKPDLKLLKGKYSGLIRLRMGIYRIIFTLHEMNFIILIIEIVNRGDAYK